LPAAANGARRVAAYITVSAGAERENWYLFCVGDTIWRLESFWRFPSPGQRARIRASIATLDTSTAANRLARAGLEHSLLADDSLRRMFLPNRADAERLVGTLRRGSRWTGFTLSDVDFGHLEEYRELDDDVKAEDLIFYTSDRGAIERLKTNAGMRRVERDPRYPNAVFLLLDTIEGGALGYVNVPDVSGLPRLSDDGFIMLKPVAQGWWLFKRVR
jgi:hypothetical protein